MVTQTSWKHLTFTVSAVCLVVGCSIAVWVYCCNRRKNYEKATGVKKVTIYNSAPQVRSESVSHPIDHYGFSVEYEDSQNAERPLVTSRTGNKDILYNSKTSVKNNCIDFIRRLSNKLLAKIFVTGVKKVTIYSSSPQERSEWISQLIDQYGFSVEYEDSQNAKFPLVPLRTGNKGILYHFRTSVRINLIDGMDPLYNKLLAKICSKFGRENVAVVVDHLNDIETMKRRIERSQKSVYKYAKYMFYFKNGCELEECSDAKQMEEIEKMKQFLSGEDITAAAT